MSKIPKLFDLVIQVIRRNLDKLEKFGDVPEKIRLKILETASAEQLKRVEAHNAHIDLNTDHLWHKLCLKSNYIIDNEELEDGNTWRDFFEYRQEEEKEKQLAEKEKLLKKGKEIKKGYDKEKREKESKHIQVINIVKAKSASSSSKPTGFQRSPSSRGVTKPSITSSHTGPMGIL